MYAAKHGPRPLHVFRDRQRSRTGGRCRWTGTAWRGDAWRDGAFQPVIRIHAGADRRRRGADALEQDDAREAFDRLSSFPSRRTTDRSWRSARGAARELRAAGRGERAERPRARARRRCLRSPGPRSLASASVRRTLAHVGFPAELLTLEITQTALMRRTSSQVVALRSWSRSDPIVSRTSEGATRRCAGSGSPAARDQDRSQLRPGPAERARDRAIVAAVIDMAAASAAR